MDKLTPKEWHALLAAIIFAKDREAEFKQAAGTYGLEGLNDLGAKVGSGRFQR